MRKKMLVSLTMIFLAAALVGGATFALFTDTSTNANNTFAAGTVDIAAGAQSITIPTAGMAPGDTLNGSFVVKNNGSLDLFFKVVPNASGFLFTHDDNHAVVEVDYDDVWTLFESAAADLTVNYSVHLPIEADNDYQAANGTLSFTVNAQQADNNADPQDLAEYPVYN